MAGATGVPFTHGNRIDMLNNGDEFYPAMLEEIAPRRPRSRSRRISTGTARSAARSPRRWPEGARGCQGQDPARRGRLEHASATTFSKTLESGGCQIAWYNPIHWYTLGRFNNRTHRKSLIIDGRVGFTGGAGIADHWLGHAQDDDHWRDMQIRVEGPAVTPLQTGFAQNWLQTTGELVSGPMYYPPLEAGGPLWRLTLMSSPETGASTVRIDVLPVDHLRAADASRSPIRTSCPTRRRSTR